VNAASLALMLVVTGYLAFDGVRDWITAALAAASLLALLKWKVNSSWLVLIGAAMGLLLVHSP
jgi:chromate transporter